MNDMNDGDPPSALPVDSIDLVTAPDVADLEQRHPR